MLALGVVMNIKTDYGASPVSSVMNVISIIFGIELGNATILCYLFFILAQVFLMKKNGDLNYKLLLQLPLGIIFGRFTTLFNNLLSFQLTNHGQRLLFMVLGVFLTALGIVITVNMQIVPLPPEGLTYELSKLIKKDLGTAKILVDTISVSITIIVSLVFAREMIGIGFGTLFCVFFIGKTVKVLNSINTRSIRWKRTIIAE